MPKGPMIRIRLSDASTLELPENEVVQVVTEGPGDKAQEGWVRINPDAKPAQFGRVAKLRAVALTQGQQLVTYRGVFGIESTRRG